MVLDALSVELPSQPWCYSQLRIFFRDHFFGRAFWDYIVSGLQLALEAFSITSEKLLSVAEPLSPDWRAISLEVLRLDFALASILAQCSRYPSSLCQHRHWRIMPPWARRNRVSILSATAYDCHSLNQDEQVTLFDRINSADEQQIKAYNSIHSTNYVRQ